MKNLNYINHEIGGVWHDFCRIKHVNTPSALKSNSIAFEQEKCRGNVIPTLAESPSNHPLITRLSPANHPLLPVFNQVKRVMRAAMVLLMLFVGVGQMWGGKGFFTDGQWNVKYYDGSGSDKWIGEGRDGSTKDLGIKTTLYLKGSWVKTWSDGGWTQSSVVWNYGLSSSYGNTKTATKSSVQGNQTWDFSVDYNVIANAPNNPGQNTIYMYWRLDDYVSSTASYINFTIPGFKKTSVSQDFGNVTVSSTKDLTISFTQHYGTALTTSNCALSGTNSSEFEVRSISETGVTVRFKPSSNGSKSATLTITDAHSKTCTITLSGKTQRAVTYKKGDNGTGSDITDYKVYNTNLTLRSSGFTRTGYNLTAWNTSSNGTSGTSYALGATYSSNNALTLYPTWTAKTTTITLNNQGATTAGTTSVTATYDQEMPEIIIPTKTGYTFGGYWGAPGGSGPKLYNADGSSNATWLNTESTYTLYAAWAENKSTVTLVASPSGKGTFQIGGETVTSTTAGVATTREVTAVPIAGYSFDSWSISGGASISSTTDNPTTITGGGAGTAATLTATFVEDLTYYKLQFGTRSGESDNGSVTAKDDSDNPLTSNSDYLSGTIVTLTATPEDDYKFDSWYPGWTTGDPVSTDNPLTFTLLEATKRYAHFVLKTTSITLNKGIGSGGTAGPVTATHGNTTLSTNPLVCPAKSGYTFTGYWTESSGGTKVIDTDGTLVASVSGYTKSGSKKWDYDDPTLTLYAQWEERMTTVTINVSPESTGTLTVGGAAFTPGNTTTAGVTTSRTVVATAANDYAFSSWSVTDNATGTSSTNTYTLKGNGSAGTGTLTANFTTIPCKLYKLSAAKNGSTTDKGAMSYDATEHAYYKDITTDASPYYFRFYYNNSAQYCTNWSSTSGGDAYTSGKQIAANGSKVDCNQSVGGWGDKPAMYYSGESGTTIRIWFDYQNKKVWITADKDKQYVLRGANADDASKADGMPGWSATTSYFVGLASGNTGTISCTLNAGEWYHLKVYDMYTKTWYGTSTSGAKELTDGTLATMGSYDDFYFGATIADSYTFTLDKSSGMKIKVDYPVSYQLNYSIGSIAGTSGSISTSPTTASGSYVPSGNTITLTAPAAKEGYTWSGWYTNASGTEGKIPDTDRAISVTMNAGKTLYACYTINNHAITHSASSNGSYTIKVGDASAVSTNTTSDYGKTITLAATPATGYHFGSWSAYKTETPATTVTITDNKFTMPDYAVTVGATFTANTYTVQFHRNGASEATVYQNFTYDVAQNLTANTYTRTGYDFAGWATAADGDVVYTNSQNVSNLTAENGATFHLYAKWTLKNYTVTLDKQTSATGYGASGTCSDPTVTYNTALPAISGTMPSGTGAYGFAGFYTEEGGSGVKLINSDGTWVNNVAGYTSADGKWIHADNITVYAFYKQAEITGITLNADIFEPVEAGDEKVYVKADPNIDPTPSSTTKICWELRYSNNNPVDGYTPIVDNEGGTKPNQVKFELNGLASGGYKIHAELRSGSDCAGTLLSSYDKSFSIANDHTVTIYYRLDTEDGPIIKASTTGPGKPLDPTEISAPNIVGYTFNHWKAGDGVTIDAENDSDGDGISEDNTISYTAIYDGKLTVVYTKKRMIYFMNTLGWSGVTVYFYKNDSYWNASNGTGSSPTDTYTNIPFSESKYGAMTQIEGTNIWYLDAEAKGVNATYTNVVFTEETQNNYHFFSYQYGTTTPNKVIRRGDYSPAMSMFVPLGDQEGKSMNSGQAYYYNEGYWMNYSENTGYTLRIYNSSSADNGTGASRTFTFPYSEDIHMPLKVDVDFNFTGSAWFMVYRHDGTLLGKNSTTLTQTNTSSSITRLNDKVKIQTSAPGIYTFTLTFHDDGANPKNYNYYINVDYPVGVGDYRILYKDNATWSQATAHSASWSHPSDIIRKNTGSEEKSDTVSLFVSYGSTISAKFQKVTAINASTGAVTWADVASGTIDLSGISKKGVYNFIVSQPAGGESISLSKTEEYTGNFYIRTDCAGNTKWDSYRTRDHQMPYTDFSMSDANTFGDKFSHYYAHWCPAGTNIKFCVANDYSACISDTLTKDVGEPYKNLDGNGTLLSDGNGDATANRYSANVRFMYNSETNKLSRAYVSAATNADRKFLVLYCESGKEILDENGNALAGAGETSRQAIFHDNENFIYDRVLQIVPGTRFKLFASYALQTPTRMDSVQYFRGTYASDVFSSDENSVVLLSGTGGAQKLRVIYDFKTNRLVAAWMPSNEPISGTLDINADVMIIRDHHNAAECITFANSSSKLDGVKTVYGAMKFNRWTLNNRARGKNGIEDNNKDHCDTPADITEYHPILNAGEQKSIYERSLYFISFPFDVKVSEIFGFGHYWDEWYLEYYDGLTRAQNGYWKDSPSNWKYVTPEMADTMVLRAYQGYILGLDLDYMEYDNTAFWANNISNVELYFPSQTTISSIKQTEVTIPALDEEYRCTINRGTSEGDRRIKDSFWRCIGVPSYNEFAGELTSGKGGSTINWQTSYSTFPFLYAWNMSDNTLTPQNTSTFAFKPMHAYLVQIQDAIYWDMVSATPSPIVARRERAEHETEHNWCLTLSKDSSFVDQTYVRMSNLEQVTNSFDFNQDLIKEMNASRSNIYTLVGYERLAANSMPIESTNTTIIPVGVNIKTTGEYTFAMPEGTNGVGITLVDTETNVRTSLSAFNYTVNLNAGQYDSRFILEISPISQTTTGVEEINDPSSNVRKLMIDGILYIIHEGKMYDARGARVE